MRNPNYVLNSLGSKANDKEYRFRRVYRNLYNKEFYLLAYSNIYSKEGNMSEGTDGKTIDGMSVSRIESLIEKMKDETYKPRPAKRVYIEKANGGKRPLGIPSFDDKLVQEIVRSILESMYEPTFSNQSHGFRPNRSCHTSLLQINKGFRGVKWFIEGDIKGFFDNIDHHILIKLLRKRIDDEKFIRLIWKFLKAGYLEDWKFHNTHSGAPQGGIISPILSNIYLNELDTYMEQFKQRFDNGRLRKSNSRYDYYHLKKYRLRKKYEADWDMLSDKRKEEIKLQYRSLRKEQTAVPSKDPMDSQFKRIVYTRYADDFLIGVIGSKEDAMKVKEDLTIFLRERLNLELSQDKTLITSSKKLVRFLGYDITISRSEASAKTDTQKEKRLYSYAPVLYAPKEKWVRNLIQKGVLKINNKTGEWKSMHRSFLRNLEDIEILNIYNAEIKGLYEYYKLARNATVISKYKHIMEYSMYKTFAGKYNTSVRSIINRYNINGKFGVKYQTKDGTKIRYFYDKGFRTQKHTNNKNDYDTLPNTMKSLGRTSLIDRLLAEKCEICGTKETQLEIHHVRKLKDLKGKRRWEQIMIARRRKTIALCPQCHIDLHAGRLD